MTNPTYMGSADPIRSARYADYFPAWLNDLAEDVTIEGSLLDGAAEGPEAVRTIVGAIRTLYEQQQFNFAGPYGDDGFLEDYTAQVSGEPIAAAVLVTRNAAGHTQHVAANYRPRSSLLRMSRLLGEAPLRRILPRRRVLKRPFLAALHMPECAFSCVEGALRRPLHFV